MRRLWAIFAMISMLVAPAAVSAGTSDDHLVRQEAVGARLTDAASQRAQNLATLEKAFAGPRAAQAAAKTGLDIQWLRNGLPQLSDRDLSDLSQRAATLSGDPVAGYHEEVDALVTVMVIAAIAIIIIEVANHY